MKEIAKKLCYTPMSTRFAGMVGWVVRRALKELLKKPRHCMPRCGVFV